MNKSISMILLITLGLLAAAWVYPLSPTIGGALFEQQSIDVPINVRQLPIDSAINAPAAEILNPILSLKVKNEIEQFSCYVKNNTDRNITAISLELKTILAEKGKEWADTNILTSDMLVHPDIKEELNLRYTTPGTTDMIQLPGPMSYKEEVVIKGIEIEIKCVIFDDGTSTGYDSKGTFAGKIRQSREGAIRYKEWLKKQNGTWPDKINAEPDSLQMPEAELPTKELKAGARRYRNWLLHLYNSKGRDTAVKYLIR